MSDFDIKIDMETFRMLEREFPRRLLIEARRGVRDFGKEFENRMTKERLSENRHNPFRRGVARRTSALEKSLSSEVKGRELDELTLKVHIGGGAASGYAMIQERGGTVRAKGKLLKVPLEAALTARGTVRSKYKNTSYLDLIIRRNKAGGYTSFLGVDSNREKRRRRIRRGLGMDKHAAFRMLQRLERRQRKKRRRGGARPSAQPRASARARVKLRPARKDRDKKDKLLFVLKKQVKIPARLGFRDTFHSHWAKAWPKAARGIVTRTVKHFEERVA